MTVSLVASLRRYDLTVRTILQLIGSGFGNNLALDFVLNSAIIARQAKPVDICLN